MQVVYYPGGAAATATLGGQAGRREAPRTAPTWAERGTVVTIGAFDGVHRGHLHVVDKVKAEAAEAGAVATVATFDRHPASVVRPGSAPLLLTSLGYKLELFERAGVELVLVLEFGPERARQSAESFVEEVLVGYLRSRAVIVGHDFHFGRGREGDVALLQRMGARSGFDVTGMRLAAAGPGGEPISSTRVRQLLAAGDVRAAAGLLGRWHRLQGLVCHGDKRGRELGFPTANLAVGREMQLPADGVYAGWYLRPDGTRHQTAISVGRQPTFYTEREYSLVEAYLLDFRGDLYDELGTVELVEHLRGQERFASVEALVDQMTADEAQTRRALAAARPPWPPAQAG